MTVSWVWIALAIVLLLAAIVLTALKLLSVIAWPWWLVLAPLWMPAVALFVVGLIAFDDLLKNGWH